jgi:hypothetical protein
MFEEHLSECARPRAQQVGYAGRAQRARTHLPANVAAPGDGLTPSGVGTTAKASFETGSKILDQVCHGAFLFKHHF